MASTPNAKKPVAPTAVTPKKPIAPVKATAKSQADSARKDAILTDLEKQRRIAAQKYGEGASDAYKFSLEKKAAANRQLEQLAADKARRVRQGGK